MEFLLSSDSDGTYKKEIEEAIVQQLIDEEVSTKDTLIFDDREKLRKLNEILWYYKFISIFARIIMLKEKFILDMTKLLNNLIFKWNFLFIFVCLTFAFSKFIFTIKLFIKQMYLYTH